MVNDNNKAIDYLMNVKIKLRHISHIKKRVKVTFLKFIMTFYGS